MKDLRSPAAKARDEWLESRDGIRAQQGTAQGQYLQNRLVLAFLAGWDLAKKDKKEK